MLARWGVGLEPLCLCLLPDAVTVTGHCVLIVAWVETLDGCEKLTLSGKKTRVLHEERVHLEASMLVPSVTSVMTTWLTWQTTRKGRLHS